MKARYFDGDDVNCDSDILDGLKSSGIFSIKKDGEDYVFTEECDNYYWARLSKNEVEFLIKQLNELINRNND